MNTIITIGRQYGSGGCEVGEKLAAKLGFEFYDSRLISLASEKADLNELKAKKIDEVPTNEIMHTLKRGWGKYSFELSNNDKLHYAQSEVIEDIARSHNAVIMGRCANVVLDEAGIENVSVFISGNLPDRISRISRREDLSEAEALKEIKSIEKIRSSYYNYYTDKSWGAPDNYDLVLNTSSMPIDDVVDFIIEYAKKRDML